MANSIRLLMVLLKVFLYPFSDHLNRHLEGDLERELTHGRCAEPAFSKGSAPPDELQKKATNQK